MEVSYSQAKLNMEIICNELENKILEQFTTAAEAKNFETMKVSKRLRKLIYVFFRSVSECFMNLMEEILVSLDTY